MKKKSIIILITSLVLAMVLIGVGIGVYFYQKNKIISTIMLDINPSVSIGLNKFEEAVKVEGLNNDGVKLLKNSQFKWESLDDVIEDITEKVVKKGYITKEKNYILISVEGKIKSNKVERIIQEEFRDEAINCNIIESKITENTKILAEKYGISENKASYIESIISNNNELKIEDLVDKSIYEINNYVEEVEKDNVNEGNTDNDTVTKPEDNKENNKEDNSTSNNNSSNNSNSNSNNNNSSNNNSSNNNSSSSNKKPTAKPTYTPPASNDRSGAWCDFFDSIPANVIVDYETPGYISDHAVYSAAAKNYLPEDSSYDSVYGSVTRYKTASYCSAGIIEVYNYDKTKEYRVYLDSVTLELLEPVVVKEMERPKVDEAGAHAIVGQFLASKYGVDINTCGHQNFYYTLDGSTKIPEWQFTCKVDETNKYYAIVVQARDGIVIKDWSW